MQKMHSQESGNNASAQHPLNFTMPAQILNGIHPMNFPFQQVLHFDPTNRNYHPHADQQHRIHLDPINGSFFQSLLNAPMCNTQTRDATKERKKREKDNIVILNIIPHYFCIEVEFQHPTSAAKHWAIFVYLIGNNQKGAAMWDRILEAWKENIGLHAIRLEITTACNSNVSKFHAQYERLERHPQSGSNSDDLRINAMRSYEDLVGAPFKFIHCWEILIKILNELTKTAATGCKQGVEHNKTTMVNQLEGNINDCDVLSDCTLVDGIERPQGRKACKERKRKLNEEKSVVDALSKLQCILEKQININQATLEMKREKDAKELQLRGEVMQKELELKERAQKLKEKISPLFVELIMNLERLKELEDDDPRNFNPDL
ncbi:NAM-like protein [Striga asiatica]|uniref:NAM-like protein n=1 Tax=Striga asiatica TaxID=4170 RepID=A0A5A7PK25_STRAF|nr:NAM-like protein [Striga asiatica]